ncbi:J domain-containing protein [Parvularcula maris]|uniref:DnaJ domain-containing protein n=1 Tax=Parvularcula maris TaxID=2965077 RepID=A0A9X2RHS3_9PROT|nr:DnaJ domain-containing protein [Parvularcula maris]MCQ8184216.1 DnaJ domain-containing protein [Parvularcula maris]
MLGFRRPETLGPREVVIELRDGRKLRGRLQLAASETGAGLLAKAKPFLTIRTPQGDVAFHRDMIAAVLLKDERAVLASKTETARSVPPTGPDQRKERAAEVQGFDPCRILDVRPGASREELKAAWRKRIAECHPDKMAARGAPADIVAAAQRQAAQINAAYQTLSVMRRG